MVFLKKEGAELNFPDLDKESKKDLVLVGNQFSFHFYVQTCISVSIHKTSTGHVSKGDGAKMLSSGLRCHWLCFGCVLHVPRSCRFKVAMETTLPATFCYSRIPGVFVALFLFVMYLVWCHLGWLWFGVGACSFGRIPSKFTPRGCDRLAESGVGVLGVHSDHTSEMAGVEMDFDTFQRIFV